MKIEGEFFRCLAMKGSLDRYVQLEQKFPSVLSKAM